MTKFIEIAKAWAISINPTEEQKLLADKRISVCNYCEYRKYNELTDIFYCGECKCPLKGKIYSPVEKSCPKNKWLA